MNGRIGEVDALYCYPVKSFAGEELQEAAVEPYGIRGDRSHAFADPAKTGWARYITARQAPHMLGYRATFASEPAAGEAEFPPLVVTTPDGAVHGWDDALRDHLQRSIAAPIVRERHTPAEQGPLAVDDGSILLVTDRSLHALEARWGRPLDRRRFRANVVIALDDDVPFAESAWLGSELAVGSALLRVEQPCSRCRMIGLDPDGGAHSDESLLALLAADHDALFGVYASVVRTGFVSVGDRVRLEQTRNAR